MPKKLIPFALLLFFIHSSCYMGYSSGDELSQENWINSKNTLTIWALADIQPTNKGHEEAFELAIKDINENVPNIDMAIVAGDIVNETNNETFDWYVQTRNGSYIEDWYEIIGNHDLKTDMGELFRQKLREDINYSIVKGNILFIFMSDSVRGKATEISDETFGWWKDLVINNQDKIIVVTTHAPLEDSGIPFSSFRDRQIINSERFTDVLRKYEVDLWLSGHLHLSQGVMNNIVEKDKYKGTIFVHISSIRPEVFGIKKSESRLITFSCGSDKVLIQSRNHKEAHFASSHDRVFKLSKKYLCNSEPSLN